MKWLVFRLCGAMAAWGEEAVGEVRASADHPTRTAILGLLAAGLGIDRAEEGRLLSLDSSLGVAVLVEAAGSLLRDYHTVQVPPSRKGFLPSTRRRELEEPDLNTVLSTRDYRTDASYRVAVWRRGEKGESLEALARALEEPHFTLYLGRRSCPPALPVSPQIVEAATLRDAMVGAKLPVWFKSAPGSATSNSLTAQPSRRLRLYWEGDIEVGVAKESSRPRSDRLISRHRSQFGPREEHLGYLEL